MTCPTCQAEIEFGSYCSDICRVEHKFKLKDEKLKIEMDAALASIDILEG